MWIAVLSGYHRVVSIYVAIFLLSVSDHIYGFFNESTQILIWLLLEDITGCLDPLRDVRVPGSTSATAYIEMWELP